MSTSAHGPTSDELTHAADPQTMLRSEGVRTPSSPDEAPTPASTILSVDEVVALYPGEWVLMKVAARHGGWPSHGQVIAHNPSYDQFCDLREKVVPRPSEPGVIYYTFQAYRHIRTGAELREAMETLRVCRRSRRGHCA